MSETSLITTDSDFLENQINVTCRLFKLTICTIFLKFMNENAVKYSTGENLRDFYLIVPLPLEFLNAFLFS